MSDVQLDLFDSSYYEPKNENSIDGLVSSVNTETAIEKVLMLIIKKMGRYIGEDNRKRIILSSLYTLHRDTDEITFDKILNSHIHDFNLKDNEWNDYYSQRRPSRRRR